MAAKQGLTAHISQASEDARRAVLSRAPTAIKSHSWLSNLNTTCTIKSAPPRSPEVMSLLAIKSGWLVKRNEQQVWQRRWCCVVPHTFLYYFEAEPLGNNGGGYGEYGGDNAYGASERSGLGEDEDENARRSLGGKVENQQALNLAVIEGFSRSGQHSERGSLGGVNSRNSTPLRRRRSGGGGIRDDSSGGHEEDLLSTSAEKTTTPNVRGPTTTNGQNLSPSGIIDLECYTSINRCSRNDCLFELTGDEITNPDLRSFFFHAGSIDDCEMWTKALLSDRHSALRDEREAYRQVCDSFQLQLQSLSDMIDEAEGKAADAERELYTVRSAVEKNRNQIVEVVKEALEHTCWLPVSNSHHHHQKHSSLSTSSQHGHHNGNGNSSSSTQQPPSSTQPQNSTIPSQREQLVRQLEDDRLTFLDQIDQILTSTSNTKINSANLVVQLLSDYVGTVVRSYTDLAAETTTIEQRLHSTKDTDRAEVIELKKEITRLGDVMEDERTQYEGRISDLEVQLMEAKRVLGETEHHLHSQGMESKMFQTQAKGKLLELTQHKKILKKEVIELRKRIDEIGSERDAALHRTENLTLQVETEKDKNKVLERYLEKVENQVTVQQNMMEMISLSGMSQNQSQAGGSVVGKIIGPGDSDSVASLPRTRLPPSNAGPSQQSQQHNRLPPSSSSSSRPRPVVEVRQSVVHSPPKASKQQQEEDVEDRVQSQQEINTSTPVSPPRVARTSVNACHQDRDVRESMQLSSTFQSSEVMNSLSETPRFASRGREIHPNNNDDDDNNNDDNNNIHNNSENNDDITNSNDKNDTIQNKNNLGDDEGGKQNKILSPGGHTRKKKLDSMIAVLPSASDDLMIGVEDRKSNLALQGSNQNNGENDDNHHDDMDTDHGSQKSHISELTEDRTQRAMDLTSINNTKHRPLLFSADNHNFNHSNADNGIHQRNAPAQPAATQSEGESDNHFPPRYIGTESASRDSPVRCNRTETQDDSESKQSMPSRQLSVAQRARMEAETSTNSVTLSLPSTNQQPRSPRVRSQSPSVFSGLGGRLFDAIDNSIIGVGGGSNSRSGSVNSKSTQRQEETSLTLEQRLKMQRERQLQVLKERGLVRNEEEILMRDGGMRRK